MDFDTFQRKTEALSQITLSGESAHALIFPEIAKYRRESLAKNPNPKLSAVAAIVFPEGNSSSLLFIERQEYAGAHSGQIGFPGGKKEEGDTTLEYTARRETEEEVGIAGRSLRLVRELSQVYIPPSGFLVFPYLFTLDHTPTLTPDMREVRQVIKLPLARLLDDTTLVTGKIPTPQGISMHTKYFEHENKKIWGATAMMLAELKILLAQTQGQ